MLSPQHSRQPDPHATIHNNSARKHSRRKRGEATNAQKRPEKRKPQRAKTERQIRQQTQKVKNEERKKDTRRKILIGAYYLEKANKANAMDSLRKAMNGYLTRDDDRALFGLPPIPKNEETQTQEPGKQKA